MEKKDKGQKYSIKNLSFQKAFTLIELLMVMGVLGVLAGIIVINIGPASQKKARDTIRRNDLKQYQTALELYANKNDGLYPVRTTAVKPATLCGAGRPLSNLSNCPNDPKDMASDCKTICRYQYRTDNQGTTYTLWAALERPSPTSSGAAFFFVVCSTGRTYEGNLISCP